MMRKQIERRRVEMRRQCGNGAYKLSFALLLVTLLLVSVSYAQVDTGAIGGTVMDESGSVVPGAKVTLTNEGTDFSTSTVTASDGIYTFSPVKIGVYTVAVEVTGFQRTTRLHVQVDIQQHVVVDFTLRPGTVTQTIEVHAPPPLLQTQNAAVGQVVGSREINNLPLNGRNYVFLAQLSAGVTVAQEDDRGLDASGWFSANGTQPLQNNFMLDGIDNNNTQPDQVGGTPFAVRPPIDALQEFKIQTSDYSSEFGRGGGAVLNTSLKSGTNQFHGDVWEFVRNDKFDAADFFENAGNIKKGEFRQNQFGFTFGGPVIIPKLYNGKNKTFFFGDYEGTRIRHGYPIVATVPTVAERNSGYTDFSDLIAEQTGTTPPDLLGRSVPLGTVFDPATTRTVTQGQVDPVTSLVATGTGYVRDPFPGNFMPAGRVDPIAVRLLNLFPLPNGPGLFNNFTTNRAGIIDSNNFDVRVDHNFSERDQVFARASYIHNPINNPSPFPGVADGSAGFSVGRTLAVSDVLSETHTFSPTMIFEGRAGFARDATLFGAPNIGSMGIPASFGIQGIPQYSDNGGLPTFNIGGLYQLGSPGYIPTYKYSNVWDFKGNVTKIQGPHIIKFGFEYQNVFIPYLVPPHSRGQFNFSGDYTSIPGVNVGATGRAQFVLRPIPSTVPNEIDNVGGANFIAASTSSRGIAVRNYYGAYVQDEWKVNHRLTLNFGVRYEYFGPYGNRYDAQAMFIPGPPFGGAQYLYPTTRINDPTLGSAFIQTLQKDGIALIYANPRDVEGYPRLDNFGPRIGFAYQVTPKLVVRSGYGIFYGGLGYSSGLDHLGTNNFPFLFNFNFNEPDPAHPIRPDNSIGLLENGLVNVPLSAANVTLAQGFNSIGREYRNPISYTQGTNLSVQYQLTPNQTLQLAYVGSFGRHLDIAAGANNVSKILPPLLNPLNFAPFPDFALGFTYTTSQGNSYYNALQFTYERHFSTGLYLLGDYTWAKCRSDAYDMLESVTFYRAPSISGFGVQGDYGLCDYDIRQVVHFSGGYELPIGKGKRFLPNSRGVADAILGGWATNFILTLQDGQPFTVPCTVVTAAGVGCDALLVPGQNPIGGKHNVDQWLNPAAFANPPVATAIGQSDLSPLGGAATQVVGPGFHRFDFSLFKSFRTTESTRLEFRAEVFNLTNHPNFSSPGLQGIFYGAPVLDFTNPSNFGKLTATRDNPNDPREIQFALKFYF
jgi:carboxypeptidase family protein/TonB-dependent receptor-like protein